MISKISAVILTKNEEDRIEKCLVSLSWVDERIVIDNGSTDKTVELAKKHNVKVIEVSEGDFSQLRNRGKDVARGDWLLYIDADEQVTPELKGKIKFIINTFNSENGPFGYFIKRKNLYIGHSWPYMDKMQRLFWKKSLLHWEGKLHETAIVEGIIGTIDEPLIHDTHRTISEMVTKTNVWSDVEAKLRIDSRHPPITWWRFLRVMMTAFWNSFVFQRGWRVGAVGWIESIYQAFSIFITYAKLWELQQKDKHL